MRQAGVIAAACIAALETMIERLADDHANARLLADGLAALTGIEFNPAEVDTNIVMVKPTVMSAERFSGELKKRDILTGVMGPDMVRLTTNKELDHGDIEKTIMAVKEILAGYSTDK